MTERSTSGRWSWLGRYPALTAATVVCLGLWVLAYEHFGGHQPLHAYTIRALHSFERAEAAFYLVTLVVQGLLTVTLALELAARWRGRLDRRARELLDKPGASMIAFGLLAGAASLVIAVTVVRLHTLSEDEKTYLFQARLLLLGRLSVEAPPEAQAFWQPFIVGSGARWSGQYFWAHPALLALGMRAGSPYIVSALEVVLTVVFAGRAAHAFTGDPRAGVLTSALVATSPLVVLTGATLHNANTSALCAAVTVWGLVHLGRGTGKIQHALAVGVATGIASHTRPLDQLAIVVAGGCIVVWARRRELSGLAQGVAGCALGLLPFLALHPIVNLAVSGDWRHNGYWLFNEGHGWITMGFGRGPFGTSHTPSIAAAKTLSLLARLGYYATGNPATTIAAAVLLLSVSALRRQLAPALALLLVYGVAYFFYAGSPILTTGPIFYVAAVPVLAGCVAVAALEAHRRLRDVSWGTRLVPAALAAQTVAALLTFWPAQLGEVERAASASSLCEDLVEEQGIGRAIVFVRPGFSPMRSWSGFPPMPSPTFDDAVLYPRQGTPESDARVVERFGADRQVFVALCVRVQNGLLEKYDPANPGRPIAPRRGEVPSWRATTPRELWDRLGPEREDVIPDLDPQRRGD